MNETTVTVIGNVADAPRLNRVGDTVVTNFRMASTARRFDPQANQFVDGSTYWVDVACWGELGGNVSRSISKGDPVIVRGVLATEQWESENGRRYTDRIKAIAVGLNLARGHATFVKQTRAASPGAAPGAVDGPVDPFADRPTDYDGGAVTLEDVHADARTDAGDLESSLT
ncbi:single-stranded DNA-binding protein [Modestobacter sp. NPDC049651]|uniref:single-stranded DNA-binding protein n=1 Tax=unclassified Modestobacter TaxID=2643866 RepID=UPI0033EDD6A5